MITIDQVKNIYYLYKRFPPNYYMPWTYIGPEEGQKKLQVLSDTVPDRLIDLNTGKRYVALYHGTTSDALEIFRQGEKAIRFDVATNKVLGMGFYLSAGLNEAKFYACLRLGQRKTRNPSLKAMVAVFGVEENNFINGALYLQYQKEEKSITGITHRSIRSLKSQPPSE